MKTIKTALFLLLTSFVLFSCAKDDDDIHIPTQQFTYNNIDYDIARAVISETGNEKYLIFFSGGLDLNAAKDSIVGFGSAVYIDLYSTDLIGEYTYNSTNSQVLDTYDDSGCAIGYDVAAQTFVDNVAIYNGKYTIKSYGDSGYSIILSNDYVELTYEGDLESANL